MKFRDTIKDLPIFTAGTAIIATAVYFFMLPSQVSVGTVTALAMVLNKFITLPVSAITLIINIGLVILGLLLVGRKAYQKKMGSPFLQIWTFWGRHC